MRFVDTNVLLYAISKDPREQVKASRANELLSDRDLGLSVQVLQEFYVQATHEHRANRLTHEQAAALVDSFRRFSIQEATLGIVLAAMSTKQRFGISCWDAAIVEAARALGCEVVLSEDLSDGQDYAGVRIENPFGGESDPPAGVDRLTVPAQSSSDARDPSDHGPYFAEAD